MTARPTAITSRTWRLIDDVASPRHGAEQMQADLDLMEQVRDGAPPALRLYTWAGPTLSVGRFQADTDVDHAACARHGVEVVRRPTGGAALLHGADLTYAVAIPGSIEDTTVQASYDQIAAALITGLGQLGVEAAVARHDGPAGPVCFAGQHGADLRVGNRKVCGSAQLRRDGVVLQHGAILLQRLEIDETDLIAGVHERDALRAATVTLCELGAPHDPHAVAAAVGLGFRSALGVTFESR